MNKRFSVLSEMKSSREIQDRFLLNTKFLSKDIYIYLILLVVLLLIVIPITGFWNEINRRLLPHVTWGLYTREFWEGLLIEAHALLLDVLVLGFIFYLFALRGQRISKIERYAEAIEDIRECTTEECRNKIKANVFRLNKLKITKLNLSFCSLQGMNCDYIDLENSKLWMTNFEGAYLLKANFKNADLQCSNLKNAYLKDVCFENTDLSGSELNNAKELTFEQLLQAKSLYGTQLDAIMTIEIMKRKPELIKTKLE